MPTLLLPTRPIQAESIDFEFQAGQTEVSTKKFQEIAKRGYALEVMALKYWPVPFGDLGLGLGAMRTRVEGKKSPGGITQNLSLSLVALDLRYLVALDSSVSLGPVLRAYVGRGAKYSVQANEDVDLLVAPAVMLRYAFEKMNDYQPAVSIQYSHDANVAKRNVQTYLFGISITTDFSPKPLPVATPLPTPAISANSEPLPTPDPVPPPAEPAQAAALDPLVFNFATGSSRLNGISRERAKELAKVLLRNASLWSKIYVTGHSDKSGDPVMNQELSRRRTDAFCEMLAKRGVPRKKMRCEALDSERLLPGLPDNAEEHRRIELVFEDYDKTQVDTLKLDIQKALQL